MAYFPHLYLNDSFYRASPYACYTASHLNAKLLGGASVPVGW